MVSRSPGTHQWRGTGSGPGYSLESSQFMMVRSKMMEKLGANPKIGPGGEEAAMVFFAPAPETVSPPLRSFGYSSQGKIKGNPFSNFMWSRDQGKTWTISKKLEQTLRNLRFGIKRWLSYACADNEIERIKVKPMGER